MRPCSEQLTFYLNQSSRWTWLKKCWKFWCIHRKTSLISTDSTAGIFWHGFCKLPFFEISEKFLRGITVVPFMQEAVTSLNYLEQYIELTFSSKNNFSCVTENGKMYNVYSYCSYTQTLLPCFLFSPLILLLKIILIRNCKSVKSD